MLKLEKICKDWKEFKLRDISFEVKEKEYFIILGHSGAGKTLLLKVIAGIHKPDSGRIYLNRRDITELPPEKRDIAYIPQNYALFPHLSVFDNIAYGLKVRKFNSAEIRRVVFELADVFGIEHLLHRKPKTLSGGEQQRVAIARALAVKPKVLLLDEPFSNLDIELRSKLIKEMKRWRKEFEFTAIHVTHNFEEAMALGDRVGVMVDGRVEQVGSIRDVFSKPKSVKVARFFGYNVLEGFLRDGFVELNDVKIRVNLDGDGRVYIVLKPDDLILSKRSGDIKALVEEIEVFKVLARVTLNINGLNVQALTTIRKIFEEGIREGDIVYVSIRGFHVIRD